MSGEAATSLEQTQSRIRRSPSTSVTSFYADSTSMYIKHFNVKSMHAPLLLGTQAGSLAGPLAARLGLGLRRERPAHPRVAKNGKPHEKRREPRKKQVTYLLLGGQPHFEEVLV